MLSKSNFLTNLANIQLTFCEKAIRLPTDPQPSDGVFGALQLGADADFGAAYVERSAWEEAPNLLPASGAVLLLATLCSSGL